MVYLGADHNGFWLKEELKQYLSRMKLPFVDCGATHYRKDDDYPDYAVRVAQRMKPSDVGILVCGSGNGMAIAANKCRGIRAALAVTMYAARKSRQDNHSNVLVLPAWELAVEKAKRIVAVWLTTKPSVARRHLRRIQKIKRLER